MMTRGVPDGDIPLSPVLSVNSFKLMVSDLRGHGLRKKGNHPVSRPLLWNIQPEQFALVEPALIQLEADMEPLQNLSVTTPNRGSQITFSDKSPVSGHSTGEPVVRFVAKRLHADDLQYVPWAFTFSLLWWGSE